MSDPITLTLAQQRLQEYLDAEAQVLASGQTVRLTGVNGIVREVTEADLGEIRRGIGFWRREVGRLSAVSAGVPTIGGMVAGFANFGS